MKNPAHRQVMNEVLPLAQRGQDLKYRRAHAEALVFFEKALARLSRAAFANLSEGRILKAKLLRLVAACLLDLGRPGEARVRLEATRKILDHASLATRPELDEDRTRLSMSEGAAFYALGRPAGALLAFGRAAALLALPHLAVRPELDPERARLAMNEGNAVNALGRPEDALVAYGRAAALLALPHMAVRPELDHTRAHLARNEGIALNAVGRREDALVAYGRAAALLALPHLAVRPELDPERACLSMNEGSALDALGRPEDALVAYGRAAALLALPHLAGPPELDHTRARLAMNEGNALDALDHPEEALVAYDRAATLYLLPHLSDRPELDGERAGLEGNKGTALSSLRRPKESLLAYDRAAALHALPHMARRPELESDRARFAVNRGITLGTLGHRADALVSFRAASAHWSGRGDLPLSEQARFARCLASMCMLLPEMAAEGVARDWALSSSDRLVAMLDLALPDGKVWDDLRGHFALFHARWLAFCLGGEAADRALVPRVLAAVQGRRLVAETLEQAMALGEAAAPEITAVLAIKAEMRELLRELGAAEGAFDTGHAGGVGGSGSGLVRGTFAPGGGRIVRDEAQIAAIRGKLQTARDRLAAAKRAAAALPGFGILAAPLSGIGTAELGRKLAPGEALVLAFPLAGEQAKGAGAAPAPERTPTWLWALRGDGSAPVVVRVGAGDAASSTGADRQGGPSWSSSLPSVVERWERFSVTLGGRGGVRRGDLGREGVAGVAEAMVAGSAAAGIAPASGAARSDDGTPRPPPLSGEEMSSFWSDLDAALASLVWEPLAATGVLDGVEDILIATAGSLHNLPFSVGRRGAAAGARLLHQSSLASFARSRGLFGARPVAPETLARAQGDAAGRSGGDYGGIRGGDAGTDPAARPGAAPLRRPVVTLLAAAADKPGQEIPLARAEQRIAARIWAAAGAEVRLATDYPLDPDTPVALAHAACHGTIDTPKGGTPGAHLLLASAVSERALLAGKPAGAWLMGACVGGRVHDDALDGNPTGIVAGALGAGSETVVAALPPLPDREAFFFGVLVTLQLAHPPLGAAEPVRNGAGDDAADGGAADGPVDLVTATALAASIMGGARDAAGVGRVLPRRVLAALGGREALGRRLAWLDAGLRQALAEDLAATQAAGLAAAMAPGLTDDQGLPAPRFHRKSMLGQALTARGTDVSICWRSTVQPGALTNALVNALADTLAGVSAAEAGAADTGAGSGDPAPSLAARLTRACLALPGPFAMLPHPDDPAAAGAIAHGIVTFHDPGQGKRTR